MAPPTQRPRPLPRTWKLKSELEGHRLFFTMEVVSELSALEPQQWSCREGEAHGQPSAQGNERRGDGQGPRVPAAARPGAGPGKAERSPPSLPPAQLCCPETPAPWPAWPVRFPPGTHRLQRSAPTLLTEGPHSALPPHRPGPSAPRSLAPHRLVESLHHGLGVVGIVVHHGLLQGLVVELLHVLGDLGMRHCHKTEGQFPGDMPSPGSPGKGLLPGQTRPSCPCPHAQPMPPPPESPLWPSTRPALGGAPNSTPQPDRSPTLSGGGSSLPSEPGPAIPVDPSAPGPC